MKDWQGKKILVIGAARQGLAASRYFASHGAKVMLTDCRSDEELGFLKDELQKFDIRFFFGSHPLDLLDDTQLVCVSGGVPLDIPIIQAAQQRHIQLINDSQIFMEAVKAKVIGITGSAGKTTTTTLCGEIAKNGLCPPQKAWVGGNIGYPLIENLDDIRMDDWVIVELSSFQLELMTISPHIALVLNITPNHLDRHGSMLAYKQAKAHIIQHQKINDIAILNRDDQGSFSLIKDIPGKAFTFGFHSVFEGDGCFIENSWMKMRFEGEILSLAAVNDLRLIGRHNLANAMAACTVSFAAGFSVESMRNGIRSVTGIAHRLEVIREKDGIRWINDSIATAPERVIAALKAIECPLVLLLGGRDKNLPWDDLASLLNQRQPKVILFGEAKDLIAQNFQHHKVSYPIHEVNDLSAAVVLAQKIAQAGDCVLLSPGGTSYDAFQDFEERGNVFRQLVEALP